MRYRCKFGSWGSAKAATIAMQAHMLQLTAIDEKTFDVFSEGVVSGDIIQTVVNLYDGEMTRAA